MTGFYREVAGGFELFVRLSPKASRDQLGEIEVAADGRCHLAAKVRALPEKGAANAALERLIAGHFGLGRSKVSIVGGHTARLKTVRIEADVSALQAVLSGMLKPLV